MRYSCINNFTRHTHTKARACEKGTRRGDEASGIAAVDHRKQEDVSQVVQCTWYVGTSSGFSRMGNDARHKMHSRNTVRTVLVRVAVVNAVVVVVVVHVGYSTGIIKCRTFCCSCLRFIHFPYVSVLLSLFLASQRRATRIGLSPFPPTEHYLNSKCTR